ncbi:MAG: hypothetical protein AAGI66_07285 [Cyanobacteria bacterium P01_H01_bin.74]
MALTRKNVRHYVVQKLLAANITAVQSRVNNSPIETFSQKDTPLINVYTVSEEADEREGFNEYAHLLKQCMLEINIMLQSSVSNAGDILDDVCEVVTTLLDNDKKLGGLITLAEYRGTEFVFEPNAEIPFAGASIRYQLRYL